MRGWTPSIVGLALIGLFISIDRAWGEDTSVAVLSPGEGTVISTADVPMEIKFIKGVKGDHLHFYVDGQFFKTTRRESATLWDLKDGKHTIEVRAASREKDEKGVEHKELDANASITITIQTRTAEVQTPKKENR